MIDKKTQQDGKQKKCYKTHPYFKNLSKVFSDETMARDYLEKIRWSDGPCCPKCGSVGNSLRLVSSSTAKTKVRPGVMKCRDCRSQYSVTVGTIFEDSHVPLNKWLFAIHLMCESKKGVSANQLHRIVGVTYKTAWFMCHRVRLAMNENNLPLPIMGRDGVVEVDETYVGGKPRKVNTGTTPAKNKRGRGTEKAPVVVLVDRDGTAKSQPVENVGGESLKSIIKENVHPSARIITDEWRSYNGIGSSFKSHETVNHGRGEFARGDVYTNTSESYFSLLKRGHIGTFHKLSKKHLHRYCVEFDFRWNRRRDSGISIMNNLLTLTEGKRLTYYPMKNNSEVGALNERKGKETQENTVE